MYETEHSSRAVSIARSPAYGEYLVSRDPRNEFHWAQDAEGRRLGYVRLTCGKEELKIRDVALADHDAAGRRALLVELIRLGKERGVERVGGWMSDTPPHRELF